MSVDLHTITAAEAPGLPCACCYCGRSEPRADLWGVSERGATTAQLDQVDRWVCHACFIAAPGARPRLRAGSVGWAATYRPSGGAP